MQLLLTVFVVQVEALLGVQVPDLHVDVVAAGGNAHFGSFLGLEEALKHSAGAFVAPTGSGRVIPQVINGHLKAIKQAILHVATCGCVGNDGGCDHESACGDVAELHDEEREKRWVLLIEGFQENWL